MTAEEENSVAYQLFHTPWLCEIPEIYCRSRVIVEQLGTLTSGIPELDNDLLRGSRCRYLTIAGMITLHEEGSPIHLTNPIDSVEIYRILMEHMKNWEYIINTLLYADAPPAEDFIIMDEFAAKVHPIATYYTGGKKPETGFVNSLKTIQGKHGSLMRLGSNPRRVLMDEPERKVDSNQHDSVSSRIARQLWGK